MFLERWGNGDLQQGKMGYSEKALSVNSAYFFVPLLLCISGMETCQLQFFYRIKVQTSLVHTFLWINNNFLPDVVVSSFSSCQTLTCLVKDSHLLVYFYLRFYMLFLFSALFRGWEEGCQELEHFLFFAECSSTYFRYLFICEWNLHCAALIPEAVTKPMHACGIFYLKLMYMVQAFWESIKKKNFMVILLSLSGICLKLYKMDLISTSLVLWYSWKGSFLTL